MKKILKLRYKGDRNYLHGTDFFNCINSMLKQLLNELCYIEKIVFRRFAKHVCYITNEKQPSNENVVGQVWLRSVQGNFTKAFWLVETDFEIVGRYEFDENSLVDMAQLDNRNRTIKLQGSSSFTLIEEIVALTKALNYSVSPNVSGKWVFGQLDTVSQLEIAHQELDINMKTLIKDRFSVNEVLFDGRLVCTIRFIVGAV